MPQFSELGQIFLFFSLFPLLSEAGRRRSGLTKRRLFDVFPSKTGQRQRESAPLDPSGIQKNSGLALVFGSRSQRKQTLEDVSRSPCC